MAKRLNEKLNVSMDSYLNKILMDRRAEIKREKITRKILARFWHLHGDQEIHVVARERQRERERKWS